ncbi:hypothetical protein LIER_13326 [Lithospermum erythrorhizon]|uniref:Uncharacterized protein n=1 Tax=Lithospermum erythrorhizon TaxID=34254 RepID=A0AAV3PX78_LITER
MKKSSLKNGTSLADVACPSSMPHHLTMVVMPRLMTSSLPRHLLTSAVTRACHVSNDAICDTNLCHVAWASGSERDVYIGRADLFSTSRLVVGSWTSSCWAHLLGLELGPKVARGPTTVLHMFDVSFGFKFF